MLRLKDKKLDTITGFHKNTSKKEGWEEKEEGNPTPPPKQKNAFLGRHKWHFRLSHPNQTIPEFVSCCFIRTIPRAAIHNSRLGIQLVHGAQSTMVRHSMLIYMDIKSERMGTLDCLLHLSSFIVTLTIRWLKSFEFFWILIGSLINLSV